MCEKLYQKYVTKTLSHTSHNCCALQRTTTTRERSLARVFTAHWFWSASLRRNSKGPSTTHTHAHTHIQQSVLIVWSFFAHLTPDIWAEAFCWWACACVRACGGVRVCVTGSAWTGRFSTVIYISKLSRFLCCVFWSAENNSCAELIELVVLSFSLSLYIYIYVEYVVVVKCHGSLIKQTKMN